ncbi:MAG: phosphate signaling complex protein PhoU [Chitinivibrionales bacterium]|nr:phosphate signaling complex protein PhoU [Chitinivibrionales bacterium]
MAFHLRKEIEFLQKKMLSLCTMVEENLRRAVRSVADRNADEADLVLQNDRQIDNMEIDVEEECLKILALHQPVAVDLRFIVSVLKMNNDLERIGDLAVNIAERAKIIATHAPIDIGFDFNVMFVKAVNMLNASIEALINLDEEKSHEVCACDDAIDELNRRMFEIFKKQVESQPKNVELMMQYLSISRHLERIADHATNIAEDVIYMIEGDIVRHRKI